MLAEGLVVYPERMRANIDLTRGLLFADAAAGRSGRVGREGAHRLVEHAAEEVRRTGAALADVLARNPAVRDAGVDLADAFDLAPAVAAAARWVDPALQHAAAVHARLEQLEGVRMTQNAEVVLGTWKLRSYEREETASGRRHDQFGAHPDGYLGYAPDGRMYAIFIRQDRAAPRDVVPTEEEGVQLLGSMVAYAGTYTLGDKQVTHHIDISWNQGWTGTDQVRFFELDGDTLTITTAPYRSYHDGKEGRSILVWDKVPGTMSTFGLDGRHALVTGASSGLGRHFARVLAAAGATVTVGARREAALAETVEVRSARKRRACAWTLPIQEASCRRSPRPKPGLVPLRC